MSYSSEQTHTSSGKMTIRRDRYNMMRFSVIALGLALIVAVLFLLFNQPKVAPPPPLEKRYGSKSDCPSRSRLTWFKRLRTEVLGELCILIIRAKYELQSLTVRQLMSARTFGGNR